MTYRVSYFLTYRVRECRKRRDVASKDAKEKQEGEREWTLGVVRRSCRVQGSNKDSFIGCIYHSPRACAGSTKKRSLRVRAFLGSVSRNHGCALMPSIVRRCKGSCNSHACMHIHQASFIEWSHVRLFAHCISSPRCHSVIMFLAVDAPLRPNAHLHNELSKQVLTGR